MIAFVEGSVDEIGDGYAVINVGGVGFAVLVSGETAGRLAAAGREETVRLYTYMNVDREGAMSLIGFPGREELNLFKSLITVSGIGPKAGLALLSAMSADELRFAIVSGDAKRIAKAPGVGRKTAERLVLELKDKLEVSTGEDLEGNEFAAALHLPGFGDDNGEAGAGEEAVEALAALGYPRNEAVGAVRKAKANGALPEDADTETILKSALRFL
jgi:Holliday junction DNA helicase RuvA